MKYKTGISTTYHCSLCNKAITLRYNFLTAKEADNIANLMLVPHFLKEHRKQFNYKKVWGSLKSLLFLLWFVPLHLVALLFLVCTVGPIYWIVEKFYG